MALNDLIDAFDTVSQANSDIKHFHFGTFSEANLMKHKEFPMVLVEERDGFDNEVSKRAHHNIRLYVIDPYNKGKKDLKTRHKHKSELKEIARTIWNDSVVRPTYSYDINNRPFFFYEKAFNALFTIAEYRAEVIIQLPCP